MEGQAVLLWDALAEAGWPHMIPMEIVMFADIGLPDNTSDREVWRFVQANRMILLTDNRSDNDDDSLERTICEENKPDSLPVLTVGSLDRIKQRDYRERCADRIAEIILELDNYLGTARIFIP
jgi:hypothetical protein